MKTITINLTLEQNGKRLPLSELANMTGIWLRGQYPEIMEKPSCYDSHDGYKKEKPAYLVYVGHEIKVNLLSLTYNYQKP